MDIDDIIEYENENTNIEFKSIQYKKEMYHELLKDVIGMANAFSTDDKYIIIGVKKKPDGEYIICPIPDGEFIDSATYQQFINDNVEPDVNIEYYKHQFKGKETVGIIRISSCDNKPYMMKKNYNYNNNYRKAGECFVRKGTVVVPMLRKDFDRVFSKKGEDFTDKVEFYFPASNNQTLSLDYNNQTDFPSLRRKKLIQSIIDVKRKQEEERRKKEEEEEKRKREEEEKYEQLRAKFPQLYPPSIGDAIRKHTEQLKLINYTPLNAFGAVRSKKLEDFSIAELEKKIEKASEDYLENDLYYLFEKYAYKINVTVLNKGDSYIEDATIIVKVKKKNGLHIAHEIHTKPLSEHSFTSNELLGITPSLEYPKVTADDESYTITTHLRNIKHLQAEEIFVQPLRVFVAKELSGETVDFHITMYGKNQPKAINSLVKLHVK